MEPIVEMVGTHFNQPNYVEGLLGELTILKTTIEALCVPTTLTLAPN
jgi:hypothetical protein